MAELIELESSMGLDRAETYLSFGAKIDDVKRQLSALLHQLKAEGKTIAGYGASATVTTLIYHFELGEMLDFIVDDAEERQGLFSPGQHIPVLSPETLYERRPDYVLILAWRFAEPIIKKHREYLERGGHFIVPLPVIEIA